MARFLIGYNDNRDWETRTAEDCNRVGLDPLAPTVDLVETAKILRARGHLQAGDFSFIINSDRPVTRLLELCQRNRLEYVRA